MERCPLKAFSPGGDQCARLITTRDEGVLLRIVECIHVDAMQPDQAVQLLAAGLLPAPLSLEEMTALRRLATRLGEWPLLLTLANSAMRERVNRGQYLTDALLALNKTLEKRGLTAFDAQNAQERSQAVKKTLGVSFDLLSANDYARYRELAIFPEDLDIPLVTIQRLWEATGGLDELDTEEVCERLYRFSLLLRYDLATRTIRLHDVIRTYLQQEVSSSELHLLHAQFLDAYRCERWADLPPEDPYLWEQLAYHLTAAGRINELVKTVTDLRYLATKAYVCHSAQSVELDLSLVEKQRNNPVLSLLKRYVANLGHLLNQCESKYEAECTLFNHLYLREGMASLCKQFQQELPHPFLLAQHPLPDIAHPALLRTLQGHTSMVNGCAYSPDGRWILSASEDKTLKVWDAPSGTEQLTLQGHTDVVNGCAYSPDGRWILSASRDETLKIWDATSGTEQLTLQGHTGAVNGCAYSPDGRWILSASEDQTFKVWDATSGIELFAIMVNTAGIVGGVKGCAYSPDGRFIASASEDKMLRIWDATNGTQQLTLQGHTGSVKGCAYSPDGHWVLSASEDETLKVWDATNGTQRLTLQGHTDWVRGCAYSPDGRWIVSASDDRTLKVWDARTGKERRTLGGHTGYVKRCAYSPDGRWILSASEDKTLKIWDATSGTEQLTLQGHTGAVNGCVYSPDGRWVLSASDDHTLKIWDATSGTEQLTLQGHTGAVNECVYSPDGRWVVSASRDETLRMWNVKNGLCNAVLRVEGFLSDCSFSPDGEHLVTCGKRGVYFLRLM